MLFQSMNILNQHICKIAHISYRESKVCTAEVLGPPGTCVVKNPTQKNLLCHSGRTDKAVDK